MRDDELRKEIHLELRRIRRGPGAFSKQRIATSDLLIDMVGEGSVEHAYTGMLNFLGSLGVEDESDVRAYFHTCGFELPGDSLNERLLAYHERFHVDERTALRRSDRGAEKLSFVIRDYVKYERPTGFATVIEYEGTVLFELRVDVPHNAMWRRPHVYINDEFQEGHQFELHDLPDDHRFATAKETWRNIPLTPKQDDEKTRYVVRIHWAMPVAPVWFTGAKLNSEGLLTMTVTNRHLGVEISIMNYPD